MRGASLAPGAQEVVDSGDSAERCGAILTNTHERLSEDDDEIQGSPDRTFGLTFAGAFLVLGGWPLLGGRPLRWWSLTVPAAILSAAVLVPEALSPLHRGRSKVAWL